MGVAFGLGAALFWGLADYCAAMASRRTGAFRVVLGFHLLATVGLALGVVATGALDDVGWSQVGPLLGVGALGALSYLTFYKALEIGPISIVSPVVSGYAAVSLILAVLILGETLTGGQIVAIVVVLLGVLLASSDLRQVAHVERRQALGLALAVATNFSIGGFVFGNAYYATEVGWLAPIFLSRAFATVLLLAVSLRDGAWRFPDRSPRLLVPIAIVAAVDTGGYVVFNLGAERAETSIVSAASAPYAVIPILAGVFLLHERPAPVQRLGIAAVVCGVVLLGVLS